MAKLLIIEDDIELANSVRRWLQNEAYTVECVHSADDAWEYLTMGSCDAIIVDWNMPGTSGLELVSKLRNAQNSTPIIMLTGRTRDSEKELGLDSGADDYLCKPFSLKELSARIRALLRRSRGIVGNVIQVADIVLDPVKHIVSVRGQAIQLFPIDFALLEFFMSHKGQSFSSESLIQRVWHMDSEGSIEGLRTSIKRIRSKIDDDDANSLIETIPRVGYRMRDV